MLASLGATISFTNISKRSDGILCHNTAVNKTKTYAQTTFEITPAEKIIARCQIGLFISLSGESFGMSESLSSSGNET